VSLINQVLKDLEQRHASEMAEATHNLDGLALATPVMRSGTRHKAGWLSLIALLIVVAAASLWWWQRSKLQHDIVARPESIVSAPGIQSTALAAAPIATPREKPTAQVKAKNTQTQSATRPIHQVKTHAAPEAQHAVSKTIHHATQAQASVGVMQKQMIPLRREQKAELAYQAGYDQLMLHKLHRAERQLRQALAIEPAHIRARELLAGVLIKQGRWVETEELMQQGVQVVPGSLLFVKLYARTLMQLNRDQQAIKLLRAHAPTVAQDPDYFALLAALYQRQQDHRDAAKTYSEILKLRPDTAIWWVGLGISLEALGKQQQAQQAYTRARQTGTLQGDMARYTDNRLLALDAINYPIH
jgi:MSHA biogenesis protein MshN